MSPILSLLLVHDLLLSKRSIAAPAKHPLRLSVERNKSRLQAEFTKARLRRKCTTIEELRKKLLLEKDQGKNTHHPRWVRVNTVLSDFETQLGSTFSKFARCQRLDDLPASESLVVDSDIPALLAVSPTMDFTKTSAYKTGEIILQDKASCFPAQLLLGSEEKGDPGDVLDACAAPGNKTTHAAAILMQNGFSGSKKVFACERDAARSKILQQMVERAGAGGIISVMVRQDFLALDPQQQRFSNVTHLLLDPSCSGSGILGREDIPVLTLPSDARAKVVSKGKSTNAKKRKRGQINDDNMTTEDYHRGTTNDTVSNVDHDRLNRLAGLQLRIIEHAMSFPAATKITYSTCSIHVTENEDVVSKALQSQIAKHRGWRVLPRSSHPQGLKQWKHRGIEGAHNLDKEQMDACIRCYPYDEYGTMGFFVCGFVRHVEQDVLKRLNPADESEEEWEGLSDS